MKIIAVIRWVFSAIRIIVTKDYGMCCCQERALETAWEYWCRKFNVTSDRGTPFYPKGVKRK